MRFEGIPREMIALRVSKEIKDGDYVNLGIGIPTLISNYLEPARNICLHSENGLLGMGTVRRRSGLKGTYNQFSPNYR